MVAMRYERRRACVCVIATQGIRSILVELVMFREQRKSDRIMFL